MRVLDSLDPRRPGLAMTAALVTCCACEPPPATLPSQPTRLEQSLVEAARPRNAFHIAINLAAAGRVDEAMRHLEEAQATARELRLQPVSRTELARLGDEARAEAVKIVERRDTASQPLMRHLVTAAAKARAAGAADEADRLCGLLRAIVAANRDAAPAASGRASPPRSYVDRWATKWEDLGRASCP